MGTAVFVRLGRFVHGGEVDCTSSVLSNWVCTIGQAFRLNNADIRHPIRILQGAASEVRRVQNGRIIEIEHLLLTKPVAM